LREKRDVDVLVEISHHGLRWCQAAVIHDDHLEAIPGIVEAGERLQTGRQP
jgi:hypothetical protein